MGVLRHSCFFCRFVDYITGILSCLQGFFLVFITRQEGMGGIPLYPYMSKV